MILSHKVCLTCGLQYDQSVSRCARDGEALFDLEQNPFVGTDLGNSYDQITLIGVGGSGLVYRAHEIESGRTVAIKVLHKHLISEEQTLRRFFREIDTMRRVNHPNFRFIIARGLLPSGQAYQILEYLEGQTLAERLQQGPLTAQQIQQIIAPVCDALNSAHQVGLTHRDIKPDNLFLVETNEGTNVKILDLGLAKLSVTLLVEQSLTRTGTAIGSPFYMSPEQCEGKPVDARSDVYSLGCVIYESITGHHPFSAPDLYACMQKHLTERALPFSSYLGSLDEATKGIEQITFQAMAKDPADRYQSAAELKEDLLSGIRGSRPSRRRRRAPWRLANKNLAIALLLVGAASVSAALLLTNSANQDSPPQATITPGPGAMPELAKPYQITRWRAIQNSREDMAEATEDIRAHPELPEPYLKRGAAHIELLQGFRAFKDFSQALRMSGLTVPQEARAHFGKGRALALMKDNKSAVDEYLKSLSLHDTANCRFYLAHAYNNVNQPQQAAAQFTYVLQQNPSDVMALSGRCTSWCILRNAAAALKDVNTAIELQARSPALYCQRGNICLSLGQYDKARADLNEALRIDSEYLPAVALREALDNVSPPKDSK